MLKSIYLKLKEYYWPAVILHLLIVLPFFALVFFLVIYLAGAAIAFGSVLVAATYVFIAILFSITMIIRGSVAANKNAQTFDRRNRSIQFSLLSVFTLVYSDNNDTGIGDFLSTFIGLIGIFGFMFYATYISQLAIEGMNFNERIRGEKKDEFYFRSAIYMPFQFVRDLLMPSVIVILSSYIVYDQVFCFGQDVLHHFSDAIVGIGNTLVPNQVQGILDILADIYGSIEYELRKVALRIPLVDILLVKLSPSCI